MEKLSKKLTLMMLAGFLFLGFVEPVIVSAAGPATVNLGTASDFVVLSKSGISTTKGTSIVGNIGVSPAAATYINGFGLMMDSSNFFSRSSLIEGKAYAADYADPSITTAAIRDMQTAYVDAAGRTLPTATELGAGNIGGMTIAPGLYKWGTGLIIPSNVTLSGGANDVWIFQIAQNLVVSSGVQVILSGGAQPSNIFWQVAGQTTLGTTSVFNGNILDQTAIILNTGATLNGRALAQTAVTLDSSSVSISSPTVTTTNPVVITDPVVETDPITTTNPTVITNPATTTTTIGQSTSQQLGPITISKPLNQMNRDELMNTLLKLMLTLIVQGKLTSL